MQAMVERNKETGEFSCVVGSTVLAKGRSGAAISRLYDIESAVNAGGVANVKTRGHGEKREFDVCIGDYVFLEGQGAIKAYRNLDWLEEVLAPTGEIRVAETPAVPVPEMGLSPAFEHKIESDLQEAESSRRMAGFGPDTGDEPATPMLDTDDGKGNRFGDQP